MIEEPYRWVEAVANRREYIETQLAPGASIAAVSCADGIVLATVGRSRQKLFEIYDRIAMGAVGHPGDIERLRMSAIELASAEGFTRSAADVSLRRLAYYSLSPLLKAAFEQVYGAPYLARLLFAEIGNTAEEDLFLRLEYDGAIATNGKVRGATAQFFGALSGTPEAMQLMESFLQKEHDSTATLSRALATAVDAAIIGNNALGEAGIRELPEKTAIEDERQQHLRDDSIEAVLLERRATVAIRYRCVTEDELESVIAL